MKNKFLKSLAVTMFSMTAFTVSAANPFADVSESSWAYQAVTQLSSQNIVEGYPDGTFKGEKNITRYEMAQIVGRLMARQDSLNAEQKATVQKLASEYADELANLGVRVSNLEKKVGKTEMISEIRVQGLNRYDNVFTGDSKYELSTRLRVNTITKVNPKTTVYGQLETYLSMNGTEAYEINKYRYNNMTEHDSENGGVVRSGHGEGDVHLNRLWVSHQFGPTQEEAKDLLYGPSKNLILAGTFPVRMGVTGYTYDGQFKGISAVFGDYRKGSRFTIAVGRAVDMNYHYTGPMMRGVGLNSSDLSKIAGTAAYAQAYATSISQGEEAARAAAERAKTATITAIKNGLDNPLTRVTTLQRLSQQLASSNMAGKVVPTTGVDAATYPLTYYPMGVDKVKLAWNEDMEIPVTYASYIYKNPGNFEFHAYGMKANGQVNNITEAYGFAASVNLTPKWSVHGEFVKNLRKLPLNAEKPHSFNYGVAFGTADILKPKSYSFGVDYIYSQAGTYFGGSSSDVADQYMAHIYKNWNGHRNIPAYLADKMQAIYDGTDNANRNYGGAKFFLAKASYVPMKGLIIDAEYGFGAKDMGGKKMDNTFMLKATAYIK